MNLKGFDNQGLRHCMIVWSWARAVQRHLCQSFFDCCCCCCCFWFCVCVVFHFCGSTLYCCYFLMINNQGGFRGGLRGRGPPFCWINFFFKFLKNDVDSKMLKKWMEADKLFIHKDISYSILINPLGDWNTVVDFIQTSYSKNIIFV